MDKNNLLELFSLLINGERQLLEQTGIISRIGARASELCKATEYKEPEKKEFLYAAHRLCRVNYLRYITAGGAAGLLLSFCVMIFRVDLGSLFSGAAARLLFVDDDGGYNSVLPMLFIIVCCALLGLATGALRHIAGVFTYRRRLDKKLRLLYKGALDDYYNKCNAQNLRIAREQLKREIYNTYFEKLRYSATDTHELLQALYEKVSVPQHCRGLRAACYMYGALESGRCDTAEQAQELYSDFAATGEDALGEEGYRAQLHQAHKTEQELASGLDEVIGADGRLTAEPELAAYCAGITAENEKIRARLSLY